MINALMNQHPILFYVFYSVLALLIGSFLNLLIYRLPLMLKEEWTTECHALLHHPIEKENEPVNLFFPRSFCPHCKNTIPFWHMLPLVSYCLLRGRCHHCRQAISWQYPIVEISCLILSLVSLWFFGLNIELIFALLFSWIILCIIVIDMQTQLIPDSLSMSLLWLGLIANSMHLFTPLALAVYSAVAAYLFLWLVMNIYYFFTKKIGMGHGDFKLFSALAAWFGLMALPQLLLIASLLGLLLGLVYLKKTGQTKDTPIPFGPFLCLAGLYSLLSAHSTL